jgi:hypothetical protein
MVVPYTIAAPLVTVIVMLSPRELFSHELHRRLNEIVPALFARYRPPDSSGAVPKCDQDRSSSTQRANADVHPELAGGTGR